MVQHHGRYGINMDLSFYNGKKVFITGHTGFKGTWLCAILNELGADVAGYALSAPTTPALFALSGMNQKVQSTIGDIRDYDLLSKCVNEFRPDIVIHMAAQPLVRLSYQQPVMTFETNVMGTVHIMESIRNCDSVKSVVNVTTDKVYHNNEWDRGYVETDYLDGYDPYSNSKSCSELVTHSYNNSFLQEKGVAVSTCRAGNVIGGGDFALDRIIPDCIRAAEKKENIIVRNPYSTRPYQHVLEPLFAYLLIAEKQYGDINYASAYNVGPDDNNCVTTGELVSKFCEKWEQGITWENQSVGGPHEASFLKLDCTKLKNTFGWNPIWNIDDALTKVIEWEKSYLAGEDVYDCMIKQIHEYMDVIK